MVTWSAYNMLESMAASGIVGHACMQLGMVTWTAYNGLESMAVSGIVGHAVMQL